MSSFNVSSIREVGRFSEGPLRKLVSSALLLNRLTVWNVENAMGIHSRLCHIIRVKGIHLKFFCSFSSFRFMMTPWNLNRDI